MANGSGLAADALLPGDFVHAASGASYHLQPGAHGPVLSYQVARKGFSAQQPLLYYLGSGNLGRTYLYTIDGYLLESPVAYYSSLHGYAMAPGLAGVSSVPDALPMKARCMRCHMSGVHKPLPGDGNHFAGLPFLHGGITCEECHGESTRHVQSKGKQRTVNPATLNAAARDSVCIRCHLEGDTSVELPGQSVLDYKAGDDIRHYLSYFVVPSNSGRSVTEVEQLSQSQCKRASGDRMSCTSCHDPHMRPDPEQRVSFYRGKCLACHSDAGFAQSHHPENRDCTSCHMPKSEVRDTPHVAWTDHRILRLPEHVTSADTHLEDVKPILPGETVTPRELGLAYYDLLLKGEPQWAERATASLDQAWRVDPSDAQVATALAFLYQGRGRLNDARQLYDAALKAHPDDVEATNNLALLLARQGDLSTAETMWKRAFTAAQDREAIGENLAIADCMLGRTSDDQEVLRTVLKFSPASTRAREKLDLVNGGGCSR